MSKATVVTFTIDEDRMFFPDWLKVEGFEENDRGSIAERLMLEIALGIKFDPEPLEIEDADNFPFVRSEVTSPAFAHGAATVYVFAGPYFDECLANYKAEE